MSAASSQHYRNNWDDKKFRHDLLVSELIGVYEQVDQNMKVVVKATTI